MNWDPFFSKRETRSLETWYVHPSVSCNVTMIRISTTSRGYRQINRRVIEFASERVTTGAPPHTSSVTRGTACRLINRAWRRDASREKRSAYASGSPLSRPSSRPRRSEIASRLSRKLYNTRILQRGCWGHQSYLEWVSWERACSPVYVTPLDFSQIYWAAIHLKGP